jgi:hypothetical protein
MLKSMCIDKKSSILLHRRDAEFGMLGFVSPACHDALAESRTAGVKEWHGEFRSRKAREKFAADLNDPQ